MVIVGWNYPEYGGRLGVVSSRQIIGFIPPITIDGEHQVCLIKGGNVTAINPGEPVCLRIHGGTMK